MTGMAKFLQVGQTVRLEDRAGLYQIAVLTAEQPGALIVELGADYVLLEDSGAAIKTRVPMHLITHVAGEGSPVAQAA